MKIESIHINNFRLLKDFKIDLENSLSLVLGKNNTGKTSFLTCLDKFINNSDKKKIVAEDFNIDYKKEIERIISEADELTEEEFNKNIYGIKLRLVIDYGEDDNTCNISDLMMDLDPDHNKLILGYEYFLHYNQYKEIRKEYEIFKFSEDKKVKDCEEKEKDKLEADRKKYNPRKFDYFFKINVENFFSYRYKSINYNYENSLIDESIFNDLEDSKTKSNLNNIINFKYISAKRNVTNKENEKTLSTQTSEIYERSEKNDDDEKKIDEFKSVIEDTDEVLGNVYEALFSDITKKVGLFGGIRKDESIIKVISTLQRKELLKGNTTVIYKHSNDSEFPEHYNGLGYMNLISMIFEIEILVSEFKKGKDEIPADINLLFIEEPEAHTHPQMQYVFIKNITELLKDGITLEKDGSGKIVKSQPFQYIISTHSSHIVANCQEFNSIKYLKKESINNIKAKNIKELEKEYADAGEEKNYRFLKQYLTLNRAELFFADKAIFIEGDTERILLPAMMKKLDLEVGLDTNELPLLSQNISVIEVGNYANIFEKLISFVGLKSLIVTDLDSVKKDFIRNSDGTIKKTKKDKERKSDFSCRVSEAEKTSNPTLLFFYPSNSISFQNILKKSFEEKRFSKTSVWKEQVDGYLQIIMQTEEEGYCARSFEDSFFHLTQNKTFIKDNRSKFIGLKNLKYFYDNSKDAYFLAEKCVDSKGSFAIDILRCTNETYSNWQIPAYIKEGLLWLRKD